MSNAIPFLLQGKNIILVIGGKSHTISRGTHMSYDRIVEALKTKDWDALADLVEPRKAIVNFGKGYVTIEGDQVQWKGKKWDNSLSRRMLEMYEEGFPIDPMIRFMENLMGNPSMRSVEQLYGFLEKNKLPITEDGYFLAFKRVREDYLDIHSGTMNNSVGTLVEMERNHVNDNPDQTCSSGLHFCSENYLSCFGRSDQPVMIVKVNPADVVSIPSDYDGAKGRACKYLVVAQVSGSPSTAFNSVVNGDFSGTFDPVENLDEDDGLEDGESETPMPESSRVARELWPFPRSRPMAPMVTPTPATMKYNVSRVNNSVVVESTNDIQVARDLVAKNIRQKKAQLQIIEVTTGKIVN